MPGKLYKYLVLFLILLSANSFAQTSTIYGTVRDSSGTPAADVSVLSQHFPETYCDPGPET